MFSCVVGSVLSFLAVVLAFSGIELEGRREGEEERVERHLQANSRLSQICALECFALGHRLGN